MTFGLMRRLPRAPRLWLGLALAAASLWGASELPYINWRSAAAPVDTDTLVIRQDAKGDGRFLAPRSGNRRHRGVDLAAPLESPVHAIRSGRVVDVGIHRGLGRFVEIQHRGNLRSLYAHLHDVTVHSGQRVRQGAVIGTVGKTGNARHRWITPHLHLEVVRGEEPINPQGLGLAMIEPTALPQLTSVPEDERDEQGGE